MLCTEQILYKDVDWRHESWRSLRTLKTTLHCHMLSFYFAFTVIDFCHHYVPPLIIDFLQYTSTILSASCHPSKFKVCYEVLFFFSFSSLASLACSFALPIRSVYQSTENLQVPIEKCPLYRNSEQSWFLGQVDCIRWPGAAVQKKGLGNGACTFVFVPFSQAMKNLWLGTGQTVFPLPFHVRSSVKLRTFLTCVEAVPVLWSEAVLAREKNVDAMHLELQHL